MMNDYLQLMKDCAETQGIKPVEFVLPSDHEANINGIRMHWLDWGNEHLPCIVLLHGGSLTAHTWDMAVLCLRHRYHIIALDQRGHGDSGWTPEDQFGEDPGDLMLEDTRAFIDHLGIDSLSLVGMSMGGINTIRYAANYPEKLKAVGIVDVAPVSMMEGQREMAHFRKATDELKSFEDFLAESRKFLVRRPEAHLRYSLTHSLKQVAEGQFTWKRDRRPRPQSRRSKEQQANVNAARIAARWEDIRNISAPTLLFRGSESKILSLEAADQTVRELQDGRLVVIERATHNVHSDNPKDFARELDRFLEEVLPG